MKFFKHRSSVVPAPKMLAKLTKQGMVKNGKRLRPQTVDSEVDVLLELMMKNNNFRNFLHKS